MDKQYMREREILALKEDPVFVGTRILNELDWYKERLEDRQVIDRELLQRCITLERANATLLEKSEFHKGPAMKLYFLVQNFLKEHQVYSAESIYQRDSVAEAIPELCEYLFDVVGYQHPTSEGEG